MVGFQPLVACQRQLVGYKLLPTRHCVGCVVGLGCLVANSDNWLRRWFPAVRDFLEKLRLSPPAPPPDNQFKMEADTAASYMR